VRVQFYIPAGSAAVQRTCESLSSDHYGLRQIQVGTAYRMEGVSLPALHVGTLAAQSSRQALQQTEVTLAGLRAEKEQECLRKKSALFNINRDLCNPHRPNLKKTGECVERSVASSGPRANKVTSPSSVDAQSSNAHRYSTTRAEPAPVTFSGRASIPRQPGYAGDRSLTKCHAHAFNSVIDRPCGAQRLTVRRGGQLDRGSHCLFADCSVILADDSGPNFHPHEDVSAHDMIVLRVEDLSPQVAG